MNIITVKGKDLANESGFVGEVISSEEESQLGKVVFINDLLPGEVGTALVVKEQKNYLFAETEKLIEESSRRIKPACEFFVKCGGCSLQQISREDQLALKLENLQSNYQKLVGEELGEKLVLPSSQPSQIGYRKRIHLHYRHGKLGFFAKGSNEIVPISKCLISNNTINQTLQRINQLEFTALTQEFLGGIILDEIEAGKCMVSLELASEKAAPLKTQIVEIANSFDLFPLLQIRRRGKSRYSSQEVSVATGSFSQVNPEGNQILIELIKEAMLKDKAVTELYAGAGNFTFAIEDLAKKVTAVESDPLLVKVAESQQPRARHNKSRFFCTSAERFIEKNDIATVLLLDPPRSGAKAVLKKARIEPTQQIIYVSCNPGSWCRDVQILHERGFNLDKVIPVDMFPETHHLELFSVFSRS